MKPAPDVLKAIETAIQIEKECKPVAWQQLS
jgi:hypothetical protein